ncbi:hypothetical protein PTQ27_09145 [Mannheimia sp. AT1]|uniref:Uncharacterized protein n=1 Tax=Mannheimia cairinae TaxID=3025936 RepID=A0ABT5MR17_9PAST|nr:hypothetical protein [Mannheimia cairinae]MDD0824622.1 hypothetical protein [Mannheimia cairinae]MDD0826449.1 hypothetical protein [Mannheimia cairinae]
MKKSTADLLAYDMAKSRFSQSEYNLNEYSARDVARFIKVLSSEFQEHLDDINSDELERFTGLSK